MWESGGIALLIPQLGTICDERVPPHPGLFTANKLVPGNTEYQAGWTQRRSERYGDTSLLHAEIRRMIPQTSVL
jgi:hypothetical protein